MALSLFIALYVLFLYLGLNVWPLLLLSVPVVMKSLMERRYLCSLAVVITIFLFLLLSPRALDVQSFSCGFDAEDITCITGHAVTDGTLGKFHRQSVTMRAEEANVKGGDVASARGLVLLSYPESVHIVSGDLVSAEGKFSDFSFNAKRVRVIKRSTLERFRSRIHLLIERRFSRDGDVK